MNERLMLVKERLDEQTGKTLKRWDRFANSVVNAKTELSELFCGDIAIEMELTDLDLTYEVIEDALHDVINVLEKKYKIEEMTISQYYINQFFTKYFVSDELKQNKILETRTIEYYNPIEGIYEQIVVKQGTKVSKSLKLFISDEKTLDYVQVFYSLLLSSLQNKAYKVVLSIDPLDFLYMSTNTVGWSSCHSYTDGCYRAGCISHMTDETSVVAYVYKKRDPDNTPIKIWRQLVYIDIASKSAVFSRHYTQFNANFEKTVRKMVAKLLNTFFGTSENWKVQRWTNEVTVKNEDEQNEIEETKTAWTYYTGLGYHGDDPSSRIRLISGEYKRINVGNYYICPICGDSHEDNEKSLFCCAGGVICCSCDNQIDSEDVNINSCGDSYCNSCYNERYATCHHCQSDYNFDDMEEVNGNYICSDCLEEKYFKCSDCDEYTKNRYKNEVQNDEYVCGSCFDNYSQCIVCGDYCNDVDCNDVCGNCEDPELESEV